jgi:hypothetical protein
MSKLAGKQNQLSSDQSHVAAPSPVAAKQLSSFRRLPHRLGNQAVQQLLSTGRKTNAPQSGASVHAAAVHGTQGSGQRLPFLNQIQRAFGRHDVSHARAHEGSNASSAANVIGASAFTLGHNVAFASAPNLHTAAHEAAHVVQQRAGVKVAGNVGQSGDVYERHADAVADRVVRGQSSEELLDQLAPPANGSQLHDAAETQPESPLQMKKLTTAYGDFEDVYYNKITNDKDEELGCEMYLRFTPGNTVDASKIALTQVIKPTKEGALDPADETKKKQAVTSGTGKDFYLDRLSSSRNPLYGASEGAAADKDKLEGWTVGPKVIEMTAKERADYEKSSGRKGVKYTAASKGQYGYRKKSGKDWVSQPAELDDWPTRSGSVGKKNSGQYFETTALAVEGTQKNSYYGSVQWGWERDSSATFKLVDFKIVSQGTPSAAFMAAAEVWNKSKTSGGEETIDLPTFEIFKPAKDVDATAGSDKIKLTVTDRVQVISKGAKATDPWKVKVVDGPSTGKEVSVAGTALVKE